MDVRLGGSADELGNEGEKLKFVGMEVDASFRKLLEMFSQATAAENTFSATKSPGADNLLKSWTNQSKDTALYPLAKGFLNDEQFEIISLVLIYTTQVINIAAFVANSLNIAVFVKLGFSEASNISFIALAATDLTLVVLSSWTNVYILLSFSDTTLPFHLTNMAHVTSNGMYSFTSRTAAWITAFISLDRCLCILLPLKVKKLMTPISTLSAVILIVTLTFGPVIHIYVRYKFVWAFHPNLNITILDVVPIDNEHFVLLEKTITVICGVTQPLLAFSIVLICTLFLVVQLKKISSWRKSVTSTKNQWVQKSGDNPLSSSPAVHSRISQKEERLVKMVVAIATIFIVSFTPTCLVLLCIVVFDQFSVCGMYRRFHIILQYGIQV
ncbi:chemosensory receptor b [Plakobranchus ocellatus]|uniref:Chemosensory receptor b n=1 Tax=Plakobranchus ocellatus TaxID=259542 RepID=A0AAV3YU24_9GAST|nr:chemosensory receptor b [Plakobranchus ocellatus]